MSTHLLRRGGVYHYHRRVPNAAVASVGKKMITLSLKTGELKVAKKLRDLQDVKWNARFEVKDPSSLRTGPTELAPTNELLAAATWLVPHGEKIEDFGRPKPMADQTDALNVRNWRAN